MRQCIIHIGMHKTGSSSIQETLSQLCDNQHLYYPRLGGGPNHGGAIYAMYSSRPEKYHAFVKRGLTKPDVWKHREELREQFAASMSHAQCERYLISGEAITLLSQDELESFRQTLRTYFDDIRIVGYVRPPKSYMESAFQEMVKGRLGRLDFDRLYPQYRKRLEKFDKVFGRESVSLYKFSPLRFPEGCVVRDFCGKLGVDVPLHGIVRANESISREAVALLFIYRRFGPGYGTGRGIMRENKSLVNALATIRSKKLRFSADAVRPVLEKHRADLDWLEWRLGEPFNDDLGTVQPDDVASEKDLLNVMSSSLLALRGQLTSEAPASALPTDVQGIAQLVHEVRQTLSGRQRGESRAPRATAQRLELRIDELIRSAKAHSPALNGNISGAPGIALVRGVLAQVSAAVGALEGGVLDVAHLGRFRVKLVASGKSESTIQRRAVLYDAP